MAIPQDYHGNKHHFREHLIPDRNEGLDVGLTGQRFGTGRFATLIVDTVTFLVATVTTLTVTTLNATTATIGTLATSLKLSFLGDGYVKTTGGNGTVSVQTVPIPLADGGTGATSLASGYIKSNGTVLSSQTVPIPVADGGTNATTQAGARTSLGTAPLDPSYVTLGTNSELSNERVLTAGAGIAFADGGAGSTLTVSATGMANPIAIQVFGG
jgi:hypothetical protein